MRTIVVTSQKGGSGKSTLTSHLAVEIARAGDGPVVVIDTDPQGTLSTWRSKREAKSPQMATPPSVDQLPEYLERIKQVGARYVLIDTAPARHAENELIIGCADLVLVPTNASPTDLWALGPTIQSIRDARRPFTFVLNRIKSNARLTAQAAAMLSRHGLIIPAFIGDRVQYAAAMIDGRTAPELSPSGPAAQELRAIWTAVRERLDELQPLALPQPALPPADPANLNELTFADQGEAHHA